MRRILLTVLVSWCLLVGCETIEEHIALTEVTHNPMSFDPLEPYEIGKWWANDHALLAMNADGRYTLWGDYNRYHPPVERGNWVRTSFAELRFMPYEAGREASYRVALDRIDERVAMFISNERTEMTAIPHAPVMLEDIILGTWVGDAGALTLTADGRYMLARSTGAAPVSKPGHRGTWRLDETRLHLQPDSPNLGPYELGVDHDDDHTWLVAGGHDLERQADEPSAADPF